MSEVASFESDGYVVLRQVIDADLVEGVRDHAIELLASVGASDGRLTENGQPNYRDCDHLDDLPIGAVMSLEVLEDIARSPRIVSTICNLLNLEIDDLFIHPVKLFRAVPPSLSAFSWPPGVHQDYPELQGSLNQVTVWIPIVPTCAESGGLPLYKNGARRVYPMEIADNPSGWRIPAEFLSNAYVPTPFGWRRCRFFDIHAPW